MKTCAFRLPLIILILSMLTGWTLSAAEDPDRHDEHDHGHEEINRGPHGGRMLLEGDFGLEISIYETGLPPEFRVYAYMHNRPLPAEEVSLVIELTRLGGRVDRIHFTPQDGYLKGDMAVDEPHSFEVNVTAGHAGNSYDWHYDHFEGRTRIAGSIARQMGIRTETAGPVTITETRTLTGRVHTNPNRLSRVRPRFPGVVRTIRNELGDTVDKGDILAT
ncbi:MAG: HlyD family secretion protein, partial [Gammaproteobacteria bacterium]